MMFSRNKTPANNLERINGDKWLEVERLEKKPYRTGEVKSANRRYGQVRFR